MTSSVNLFQVDFLLRKFKYILNYFMNTYLEIHKHQHFNRKPNSSHGVIYRLIFFSECLTASDSQAFENTVRKRGGGI